MRDFIEARLDVSFEHPCETTSHELLTTEDGMVSVSMRPKPVRVIVEFHLKDRFQGHANGFLDDLVPEAGDAQRPQFTIGLWNHHPAYRLRLVGPTLQLQTQLFEPTVESPSELSGSLAVHAWCFEMRTCQYAFGSSPHPLRVVHQVHQVPRP